MLASYPDTVDEDRDMLLSNEIRPGVAMGPVMAGAVRLRLR